MKPVDILSMHSGAIPPYTPVVMLARLWEAVLWHRECWEVVPPTSEAGYAEAEASLVDAMAEVEAILGELEAI